MARRRSDAAQRLARAAPALHHLHPAAGRLKSTRLRRAPHDGRGASPLSGQGPRPGAGRADHLHAHRLGDALRPGAEPGRRLRAQPLRRGVRRAARLPHPLAQRPGSARSDPPHRPLAHPRVAARNARRRRIPALRADLAAHRRQPDGRRARRANLRRVRGPTARSPRRRSGAVQRLRASRAVRWLVQGAAAALRRRRRRAAAAQRG